MSVELINRVVGIRGGLIPSARLLLLLLANHANQSSGGFAHPDVGTLVEESGLGRQEVYKLIRRLADAGVLEPGDDDEGHSGWYLHLDDVPKELPEYRVRNPRGKKSDGSDGSGAVAAVADRVCDGWRGDVKTAAGKGTARGAGKSTGVDCDGVGKSTGVELKSTGVESKSTGVDCNTIEPEKNRKEPEGVHFREEQGEFLEKPKPARKRDDLFDALADVCKCAIGSKGGANSAVGSVTARLREYAVTPDEVRGFAEWWADGHAANPFPSAWQVQDRILQYRAIRANSGRHRSSGSCRKLPMVDGEQINKTSRRLTPEEIEADKKRYEGVDF